MAEPVDHVKRVEENTRQLAEQLLEIGRRCAALPDLGYDEHGLPE
jgi:hypothetical protein